MKAGTIVRLPDGREGTAVYSSIDGVGIKWGRHSVAGLRGDGNMTLGEEHAPEGYELFPDAMLRDPYPSAALPCVGVIYEVVAGG